MRFRNSLVAWLAPMFQHGRAKSRRGLLRLPFQVELLEARTTPAQLATSIDLRERVPTDPKFGDQFFHPIINTPDAFDKTVGSSAVLVAILDDGVDINHPDLKDNVFVNRGEVPGDGIDNDNNGFIDDANGYDFVSNNSNVFPDDNILDPHGTAIAGLLSGRIDNGIGGAGVAGNVRFLPLKVIGNGATTSLTIARAVQYAVQNGAKIINSSINIDSFVDDPTFKSAVAFAYARGVLWINSAGNSNTNNAARQTLDELLLVSATDRSDAKTDYSNYGPGIDIAAPGGTATDGLVTTLPGGSYGTDFGTSMAAPLVAGTAALIWSAYPNYTRDQVAATLIARADNIDATNPSFVDNLGSGRVDAAAAVSGDVFVTGFGRVTGLPVNGGTAPESLDSFSIRLKSPLSPSSVNLSNFELRFAGADDLFNTADDTLLPLTLNEGRAYRIGANALDFRVGQDLQRGLYRFTAKSGGLTDPFGRAIDGDGDGTAGGDFVRVFGVSSQVQGTVYDDARNLGYRTPTNAGLPGQTVYADLNNNNQLDKSTYSSSSSDATQPIPDGSTIGSTASVRVSGAGIVNGALSVTVVVMHPNPSQLTITLVAPDGDRITLLRNRTLGDGDAAGTQIFTFEDGITESIDQQANLNIYRLVPDEPLSTFAGRNADGDWQIIVTDDTPGGFGVLSFGSITIASEPSSLTDAAGNFTLSGIPNSTQTVRVNVVPSAGWQRSAGGGVVTIDFTSAAEPLNIGFTRTSGIYGQLFRDDGNGNLDDVDTPLQGATVYLDQNENGTLDAGERFAITDLGGNYSFGNIADGQSIVRVVSPAGFFPTLNTIDIYTVTLSTATPLSFRNDFLFTRDSSPVRITSDTIPEVRNTPLGSVNLTLSEPIPGFTIDNVQLLRNGQRLTLTGATLNSVGIQTTIDGLANLTQQPGNYELRINPPAPPGEPSRRPTPISLRFINDQTAPVATLVIAPIPAGNPLPGKQFFLGFNESISGFDVSQLQLSLNGVAVPTAGVGVVTDGQNSFTIALPAELIATPGNYLLAIRRLSTTIRDAAGNAFDAERMVAFTVEPPPPPIVRRTAVGTGPRGVPNVAIFDSANNRLIRTITVFDPNFTGGVRVATGDLTGDGIEDVLAASGPGGPPTVKAYNGATGEFLFGFSAFETSFTGGVFVSTGDFNGDNIADIIVSPDEGGGPRVRILDGKTQSTIADFFGIDDPDFRGGARTAAGDFNGDGKTDLAIAAGFGGGPRVAIFDGKTIAQTDRLKLIPDFFAYESSLRNGVYLAAGDLNGDGFADLVFGAGPGGAPRVTGLDGRILSNSGERSAILDFFAGSLTDRGGAPIALKDHDLDGRDDLDVAEVEGGTGKVRIYFARDYSNPGGPPVGDELDPFFGFAGGVFVG